MDRRPEVVKRLASFLAPRNSDAICPDCNANNLLDLRTMLPRVGLFFFLPFAIAFFLYANFVIWEGNLGPLELLSTVVVPGMPILFLTTIAPLFLCKQCGLQRKLKEGEQE